jgi:hypothetical protein
MMEPLSAAKTLVIALSMNIIPVFTQADEWLFGADWLEAVPYLYVGDGPVSTRLLPRTQHALRGLSSRVLIHLD